MKALVILLAAAASVGFVVWLLGRRSRRRQDSQRPAEFPVSRKSDFVSDLSADRDALALAVQTEQSPHGREPPMAEVERTFSETENQKPLEGESLESTTPYEPNGRGLAEHAPNNGGLIAESTTNAEMPPYLRPENSMPAPPFSPPLTPEPFQKPENVQTETAVDEMREDSSIEAHLSCPDPDGIPSVPSAATPDVTVDVLSGASEFVREEVSGEIGGELAQPVPPIHSALGQTIETPVPRYRPPTPRRPQPRPATIQPSSLDRASQKEVSLEIRVRLMLDRAGLREIGFLPVHTPEVGESDVDVKCGEASLRLVAQEDWYQDLQFDDIGTRLQQGVELRGNLQDGRRARWLLSGRDLYILATHPRASGFVSTNRLMVGRSHVVLCTPEILPRVEEMLGMSRCQGYSRVDDDQGVPQRWIALRDVKPTAAISLDLGDNLFNAVKPTPDIEIELEGGVCLRHQIWLAGYPPTIKLFGGSNSAQKVFIDGKEADDLGDGLVIDGYDLPGPHTVHCDGLPVSRSYSVEEPSESWDRWPAYQFTQADICGPLVCARDASKVLLSVPMTNPLLIGAEPGQVFRCPSRSVSVWKGYVPFDPVWALPSQPLICDKKTARIIQLNDARVVNKGAKPKRTPTWCNALLDASRKGLSLQNGSLEAKALWVEYKKVARNIRRAWK